MHSEKREKGERQTRDIEKQRERKRKQSKERNKERKKEYRKQKVMKKYE